MRVVLVEPDAEARSELVAGLQRCGIAVAPFADLRLALLFSLGRLGELEGVLVNDDGGRPSWLRRRLEMLPAAPPVLTYSGSHPEREAVIGWRAGPRAATRPRSSRNDESESTGVETEFTFPNPGEAATPVALAAHGLDPQTSRPSAWRSETGVAKR